MKSKIILPTLLLVFAMLLPLMMFMPTAFAASPQTLDWVQKEGYGGWYELHDYYWFADFSFAERGYTFEAEPTGAFNSWTFSIRMENIPVVSSETNSYLWLLLTGENRYDSEYTEVGILLALTDYLGTDYYDLYMHTDGYNYWLGETSATWLDITFERQWDEQWESWCLYVDIDGAEDCYFLDMFIPDVTLQQRYFAAAPSPHPMQVEGWKNDEAFTADDGYYTLTLSIDDPSEGYTVPPVGVYENLIHGEEVKIEAFANPNYEFHFWYINGETNQFNPLYLIMDGDKSVVCHFKSTSGGGGGGGNFPL